VRFSHGSWFDALPPELRGSVDVIVSNPPYIAEGDPEVAPDVLGWEPHGALFSGPDGLDDMRLIVSQALDWLRPGGVLLVEFGYRQAPAVLELLASAGYGEFGIRQDLAGRDRIAYARR
jgi:release factor glutamine methyltransferase